MRLYLGVHSPKISNWFSTPVTKSLTTCLTPARFVANAHYEVRIFWSRRPTEIIFRQGVWNGSGSRSKFRSDLRLFQV
jgi:hypothetical protein